LINHETSKVPFPYNTASPTAANGENDFDNAQVSQLILNQHSAGILNGSFAISSSSGYQRFCSNYLATSKEGFDREILFTNEESPDYVFRRLRVRIGTRRKASWPGGRADVQTGTNDHEGRHNHENSIPVRVRIPVVFGDDTFCGPYHSTWRTLSAERSRPVTFYFHCSNYRCLAG
jgi:hypothetical protein